MSGKKDALVNIGGWLAVNDEDAVRGARNMVVVYEGLHTYGGMAGRDMEAMARGIVESRAGRPHPRAHRPGRYLGELLTEWGMPIVRPIGGHAVFLDAKAFYPQLAAGRSSRRRRWRRSCISIPASAAMERGIVVGRARPEDGRPQLSEAGTGAPHHSAPRLHAGAHGRRRRIGEGLLRRARRRPRGLEMVYEPKYLRFFQARFERL